MKTCQDKTIKYILVIGIWVLFGICNFGFGICPALAAGPSGTVLDFDGSNDYISAPDNTIFDQANMISISVWIEPDDTPAGDEYIVYRYNNYYLKMDTNRKIIGSVNTDSARITSTSAVTCDGISWTHLEMTYDKDATGTDEIKLYINGILDAVGDYSTAITANAEKVYVGAGDIAGDDTPENYFDGAIGDIKIYSYARSSSDVRLDFNSGLATKLGPSGKSCSEDPAGCMGYGLVGYWNMDEGGGTTAYNYAEGTTSLNNGTLTNGPKWTKGRIGNALSFDGKDDYVNCGNNSSLYITDAITVEAWFKAEDSPFCSGPSDYNSTSTIGGSVVYCDNSGRMWSLTANVDDGIVQYTWGGYGTDEANLSCVNKSSRPACNYCDNLNYANFSDWTLPSCLGSGSSCILYQFGMDNCGWTGSGGQSSCTPAWDTNAVAGTYWTSTQPGHGGDSNYYSRTVLFDTGGISYQKKTWNGRVRCVRRTEAIMREGAFGIQVNETSASASINYQTISAAISFGWNHIILTYNKNDGSNQQKLYVNGMLENQATLNQTICQNTYNFKIGNYFDGLIDELKVYNRALSAEEVRYHYNKGAPIAHWKFDEGQGTKAYDESDNNNDCTLTNGPTWVSGKYGSALSFDGSDDYVEATISQTKTTYSLWVRNSGVWEHVAKVGSDYYVNGIAGATPTSYPIYVSGNTVQIGKTDVSTYFNGLIDDVRIYNYARTVEQIRMDYQQGMATHIK